MASIRFLKARKRWQIRWRAKARNNPYIFEGSKVFLEKSQAVSFYADIEAQEKLVRSGQAISGESICDIVDKYLRHISSYTKRTQQHYRMVMDLFLQSMPKSLIRIHQIKISHLQDYLYRRKDFNVKNRTINAHITVLKSFCRYYSERYGLDNPAKWVKMLTEEPPDNRFLTKEQYKKLLDIAPPLAKNRIIFLANTGLRASEFASLSFENVGIKSITITGKGRRRRTIPLNRSARAVLSNVQPASRKALYLQFSHLAKKLDLPAFGPNALRHYFGTQLLLAGVAAAKVAKLMGNSVRILERHYSHILTADIDHATDVLDTI